VCRFHINAVTADLAPQGLLRLWPEVVDISHGSGTPPEAPMRNESRKKAARQVRDEVRQQFRRIEDAAAESPGLETLLRVYGGYEAAARQ